MKKLFYYCYYKFSKFYEDWGEKDGHIAGSIVLFIAIGGYILSIMAFIFSLFNKKFNLNIIAFTFVVCGIISLFFIKKEKYKELEQRYKNEKHRKLKGWLMFLFFVGSLVLFFVSLYVFDV